MPKIAYVFDEDVDIYDDGRVKWAQAWRYNPGRGTLIVPGQNTMPLDPSLRQPEPPFSVTKIGFDCTMGAGANQADFEACVVTEPVNQPDVSGPLTEAQIIAEMTHFIRDVPRTWQEILEHFAGQPYPIVYRAFGQLRPTLGRRANASPNFPYTFSEAGDFVEGSA